MSYHQKFHKDIEVPVSISISNPSASAHGENATLSTSSGSISLTINGRTHYYNIGVNGYGSSDNITHYEPVTVDIEVDTDEFDESVKSCNNHVNALTGSVAATEVAHVKSIHDNSKKVADTIITGFFKNVQSEISSQVVQLKERVDATLMHLQKQAETLKAKQAQMQDDYERTKSRYTNIFTDLNKELDNRIKALDSPIFKMAETVSAEASRMMDSDFTEIASVVAEENSLLSAQIEAALTKNRARQAIMKAADFLRLQKAASIIIDKATISSLAAEDHHFFAPVCIMETSTAKGAKKEFAFDTETLDAETAKRVEENLATIPPETFAWSEDTRNNVEKYFNAAIRDAYGTPASQHDVRVVNMMNQLFRKH